MEKPETTAKYVPNTQERGKAVPKLADEGQGESTKNPTGERRGGKALQARRCWWVFPDARRNARRADRDRAGARLSPALGDPAVDGSRGGARLLLG